MRSPVYVFFRKVFFRILFITGIGRLLKYVNDKNSLVPILLFHRVSDHPDPYWPPLSIDSFKKIVNFFGDKYKYGKLSDLFQTNAGSVRNTCFIVFDDAYKDFLENAFPFLNDNKIPVTMFVPIESVDTGKPIWTTWLNMCIEQANVKQIKCVTEDVKLYDISHESSKIVTAKRLTAWLKTLPYKKFKEELGKIINQTGENIYRKDIGVMNWNEIDSTKSLIDYQSHTITHPMLENIEEEDVLMREVKESGRIIEKNLGIPIKYISYPIGSYSKKVTTEASKQYEAAFAVDGRLVNPNKLHDPEYRYSIPRFNVSDSDPYELFFRVNGFHKFFGR